MVGWGIGAPILVGIANLLHLRHLHGRIDELRCLINGVASQIEKVRNEPNGKL